MAQLHTYKYHFSPGYSVKSYKQIKLLFIFPLMFEWRRDHWRMEKDKNPILTNINFFH